MQTELDKCPLCGTELSQTKFREIRAKMRQQEEKGAAELAEAKLTMARKLESELTAQFEQQRRAAEKKIRAEAEQITKKAIEGREQMASRLKGAESREAEIRKQAQVEIEKQKQIADKKARAEAKQEAEQQIRKIAAERDLAAKGLEEANEREARVRKQAADQAEKERQKQLNEQRQILEKDRNLALLKQQSEHNREKESLQKKLKMLEHQIEKKTANELGDGGEIDVFEKLRDAYQGDRITRIQKGKLGPDILHEVLYKGEVCGRIITDAKNRQSWQNAFVVKLRQDKVDAKAEHAILATTVFPAGEKNICLQSGIIVVSPAHVVYVTELLRQAMITMHIKGMSLRERSTKMTQLYALITSESYSKKFAESERLAQDILDLDVKEQNDHAIVWRKRGTLATRLKNVLREVETDIASVIEGGDPQTQEPTPAEVKRVSLPMLDANENQGAA